MGVAAVGCDHVIVFSTERNSSGGYRFLSDVEVEKSSHFSLGVWFLCTLLEATHSRESTVDLNLILRGKFLVDLVTCVICRCVGHSDKGKMFVYNLCCRASEFELCSLLDTRDAHGGKKEASAKGVGEEAISEEKPSRCTVSRSRGAGPHALDVAV